MAALSVTFQKRRNGPCSSLASIVEDTTTEGGDSDTSSFQPASNSLLLSRLSGRRLVDSRTVVLVFPCTIHVMNSSSKCLEEVSSRWTRQRRRIRPDRRTQPEPAASGVCTRSESVTDSSYRRLGARSSRKFIAFQSGAIVLHSKRVQRHQRAIRYPLWRRGVDSSTCGEVPSLPSGRARERLPSQFFSHRAMEALDGAFASLVDVPEVSR